MEPLRKVTACITRGEGEAQEFLVFRHPTAGVQLPAGTVEEGEAVEAAVLREVWEETGLRNVILVRKLAIKREYFPGEAAFLHTTTARTEPGENAPVCEEPNDGGRCVVRRGIWVKTLERREGFTRYLYEENDLITGEHYWSRTGWVPSSSLADHAERHFFHLATINPTPERWTHLEDGREFSLYWVPLHEDPHLVEGQKHWLDIIEGELAP